jgi:hypothetical protein
VIGCSKGSSTSTSASKEERRQQTERTLDRELSNPSSVEGQPRNLQFIKEIYLPGLKRAKNALDDLQSGAIVVVPIAVYARPIDTESSIIWMCWLQSESSALSVDLVDEVGTITSTKVPFANNPTATATTYLRNEVFILSSAEVHMRAKSSDITTIRSNRPIQWSSLRLRFITNAKAANHEESIPIFILEKSGATSQTIKGETIKGGQSKERKKGMSTFLHCLSPARRGRWRP